MSLPKVFKVVHIDVALSERDNPEGEKPLGDIMPEQKNPARCSGGMFPSEADIAKRLNQHPSTWKAKSNVLEREDFPRIDPLMGGRYWPAVIAWWNRRYGLTTVDPSQPDGEEDLNALR